MLVPLDNASALLNFPALRRSALGSAHPGQLSPVPGPGWLSGGPSLVASVRRSSAVWVGRSTEQVWGHPRACGGRFQIAPSALGHPVEMAAWTGPGWDDSPGPGRGSGRGRAGIPVVALPSDRRRVGTPAACRTCVHFTDRWFSDPPFLRSPASAAPPLPRGGLRERVRPAQPDVCAGLTACIDEVEASVQRGHGR